MHFITFLVSAIFMSEKHCDGTNASWGAAGGGGGGLYQGAPSQMNV